MTSISATPKTIKFRDYQDLIIKFELARDHAGVFADPGMGKTSASLAVLNVLTSMLGANPRVLLVAPLRVCRYVWPAEIAEWRNFAGLTCSLIHGSKKEKEAALNDNSIIKLINPEGLPWLFSQKLPTFDVLIVDESPMFKSPNSVRFRTLRKELDRFPVRYILTGAPTPLGLMDLWSQCYILDKGESLGKYITRFREEYFNKDQKPYQNWATYTPKPGAAERIAKKIAHMCIRIDAKEYRSLPPLIENVVRVDLPPAVRKAYDRAFKELILDLNGQKRLIDGAGSKYAICCQLANGRYFDPDHNVKVAHGAKTQALKELWVELGYRPILIGYQYTHDLEQLKEAFPSLAYFGKNEKEDSRLVSAWNSGELPMIAAQYSTISHGLNLQYGGREVVWFSLIDNWGAFDQFNRRIYGRDLEVSVTVHLIVTVGTVDELKLGRLRSKESGNADLCRRLLEQGRKGQPQIINQELEEQKESAPNPAYL